MDDDKVYVKLQGHWIIEMSEMLATSNAKSIDEEIRSFISRQRKPIGHPMTLIQRPAAAVCVRRFV